MQKLIAARQVLIEICKLFSGRYTQRCQVDRRYQSMATKEWWPEKVLNNDRLNVPYAILVLNRKILLKPFTFLKLWNNGEYWSLMSSSKESPNNDK